MIDVLNRWARFLCAPLLDNRQRRIQGTMDGAYGRDVVEEVQRVRAPRKAKDLRKTWMAEGNIGAERVEFAGSSWHDRFMSKRVALPMRG